jgi:DNA topoisomerase-1
VKSDALPQAVPPAAQLRGAGLRYVSDADPGYSRRRSGSGWSFRDATGRRITDAGELRRIRALAVPPAYTQVWICARADGHLQATGRDARGRKQYRYHADWSRLRDEHKFERMVEFGAALPRIRAQVRRDLSVPGVGRAVLLAAVVRLLDTTRARVGNDAYARENGSYGLTTLRRRHADVAGSRVRLRFRGKSGVQHEVDIDDPAVARVVRRCQQLGGQELFRYVDAEGAVQTIDSADVNDYLRAAAGGDYTAKDFRTWHGSVHALALLCADDVPDRGATRVKRLVSEVARALGNTVAVCRKAYVHPRVLQALAEPLAELPQVPAAPRALHASERLFLAWIAPRGWRRALGRA